MTTTMPPKEEKQQAPSPPGNTTGMEAMALEDLTPAPALPPGVYFSPTKPESVLTYLNRWIAGEAMPDARGLVIEDDVYGENPDALVRKYRPASTRNSEPSWWFLCYCKLQPTRGRAACRGDRRVATGGYWKLEQTKQEVKCAASKQRLGFKRSFGFYVHDNKDEKEDERPKTWWLMEEYTSVACPEEGFVRGGDGKRVLPALYRMYVTPRDPSKKEKNNNKKKRGRDDDGENDDNDGAPNRPGRAVVPVAYFDAIAALLPASSVRGVGQGQSQDTEETPLPPPQPGVSGQYQGYDESSDDDHGMNIHEMYAMPEERQGNTDGGESHQQRDLVPVNEGIDQVWQMGREDVLADSSWIDEHYAKPE